MLSVLERGDARLWSTKEYNLLKDVPGIFDGTVFPMTFVGGSVDTIIAIDETGNLKEIRYVSNGHQIQTCDAFNLNIRVLRNINLSSEPILWSHFSADGRTLVYECKEKSAIIHVCNFGESSMDRMEITVDKEFRKFPVLSNNGKRMFVLDLAEDGYDASNFYPTVLVWKDLSAKKMKGPALLTGDRAIWGPDGQYIAALYSDPSVLVPYIDVYDIRRIRSGSNNKPWRQRKLSYGTLYFQAKILPRRRYDDDLKILICEVGASEVRRFLIWNATKDKVRNEIDVTINTKPFVDLTMPFTGPRLLASGNANLTARRVEETAWKDIDPAGYMLVAEQDVYPKFCISKDDEWIAAFSWRHRTCSIASRHSGVTMCSFTLPDDEILDPSYMLNAVQFDPAGLHLMIFGDKAIYACSPSFVCVGQSDNIHQVELEDLQYILFSRWAGVNVAESLVSDLNHSILAEEAMFRLASGETSSGSERVEKTAKMVRILAGKHLLGFYDIPQPSKQRSIENSNGEASESEIEEIDINGDDVDDHSISSANSISRAFIFETADCCSIYFIYNGTAVIYRNPDDRHIFNLNTSKCLAISLIHYRTSMMVLNRKSVCRVDLIKEEVVERIDYAVDFRRLIKKLKTMTIWTREGKWNASRFSGRCIADYGGKVLLGWDTKNGRSITVTPTTKEDECLKRIEESGGSMSDFCCLSYDGTVTMFVETEDLKKGRLTVCLYDEESQHVVAGVHALTGVETDKLDHAGLCALLECLFFDMTPDCLEVITMVAGKDDVDVLEKKFECIRRFHPWARKDYIPDYSRLTKGTYHSRADAIKEAVDEFGFDNVLNMQPTRCGDHAVANAIEKEDVELRDAIFELAKKEKGRLRLTWRSLTEENYSDLIDDANFTNDGILIKKILALIGSGVFPFIQAAKAIKSHMRTLLKRYPEMVETALLQDQLLVEIAQVKVLPDYLHSGKRETAAIHIHTSNDVLQWQLDEEIDQSENRWFHNNREELDNLEQGEYHPTVQASLKSVCFDNAAGIGMEGIIRPLLMWKRRLSTDIFKSCAVKSVVLFKWYKIWRPRFIKSAMSYFIFLTVFTIYAILIALSPDISEDSWKLKLGQGLFLAWIALFGLSMLLEEIRQIISYTTDGKIYLKKPFWGVKYFFCSRWNLIDTTSCFLVLFFIPGCHLLALVEDDDNKNDRNIAEDWLSGFIAIEAIIASIKVWYFAQPFANSGALVLMVENIMRDCLIFLGLLFFILFGFALAMHVLFRRIVSGKTDDDAAPEEADARAAVDDAFGSFQRSLHTMFYAMIGAFEPEIYSHASDLSWLVKGIFAAYVITQMIVLLNLLIAIMGDTFDKVKNREEAEMLLGRASIIDASEASMTRAERENLEKEIGRYLHLLTSMDDEEEETTQWVGRVQAVERTVKRSFRENEKMVRELVQNLESRLDETVMGLGEHVKELGNNMGSLESKMAAMDEHMAIVLDKLLARIERKEHT